VLFATDHLTVGSAAAVTIFGAVLVAVPGIPLLTGYRPVFRRSLARAGLSFGLKAWIGGLARTANGRLDQVMMITAVAPRELGLYAVATTLAGASGLAAGGLAPPLMARVGAGERRLIAQAVRVMLEATIILDAVLALAAPLLLSVLFGSQFKDAYAMTVILLAAQVPLTAATVLSSALQADGAPMIPTIGELIAVVITVAGLVLLLGPLGGVGAAIVSLVAYTASFAYQLVMAHRRIGLPVRAFLIPTVEDLHWVRSALAGAGTRLREVGWTR
jgi:O-antigen/teichoic acid export membrane protein